MITPFQSNISQHCWAQHVACIWPPCCDVRICTPFNMFLNPDYVAACLLCSLRSNNILIFIMMFPSINTLSTHAVTFTWNIVKCGNCELRLLGWNTVYMLAFHTEDILKAALTTSNGLAD